MEFAAPIYGLLVIPVLLVLLFRLRAERRREEDLRRFAEPHLLPGLLGRQGRPGPLARLLLPALTMLLLVVALMRPQWGIVEEEHASSGIDLLFAIDLSRSMLADDLSPSRLAVAKRAVALAVAS
ncbi:MAG: BatB protein, partial [Geobacter sp.]|nr:BatB protein [Geobacter sp.]